MSRLRLWFVIGILCAGILLTGLSGCGGSSSSTIVPPPTPSYTLTATALTPSTFDIGATSTSTVTVTPANGYTGTVSLSCSVAAISTSGTPPACAFSSGTSTITLTISNTSPAASTLTVTAPSGTPGGNYTVTVSASDANKLAPSNGPQKLPVSVALPSYTLAASALTPASVDLGGKATSNITVTPVLGYTGTVTLSCSSIAGGLPSPTCSFNPASVVISSTSAGPSTLTVSTTSSTAGGSYLLTVTGSDANGLAPSNGVQGVSLTVLLPSYTLAAAALTPGTVTAGNSSTSTVTVTPVNGYTGSVSLSCSSITGEAPAPTCAFNPSPLVVSGSSAVSATLTVNTSTGAPNGSNAITVSASDGKSMAPSNGSQNLSLSTLSIIQHVVIIFQENRTPDNLFQGLCISPYGSASACNTVNPTNSQYDLQSFGVNSSGQTIPLSPIDLGTTSSNGNPDDYDLSHAHKAFTQMCDLNTGTNQCAMDGADEIYVDCSAGATNCPPPNAQFMYVYPNDVQPYLTMAQTYTFADHMFQTNEGPSMPAHQFIISGTSVPAVDGPYANGFAAENPLGGGVAQPGDHTGCTAPIGQTVALVDPFGIETDPAYPPIYPCFEHPTLTDSLDTAGLSWRYYAPSEGSIWTAPNAIQHMCGAGSTNATGCDGPDWTSTDGSVPKVVLGQTQANAQVLTDIANNQLQQVSWVIPAAQFSDHAASNTGCGPSWVTQVVNAVGNSPYWSNTVIIIAWDDWGGWYDHVPPPQVIDDGVSWGSGYVYGFRVPMVVISPYAKPAYVSHVNHDFGSILKYIETNFNLPSLGYADTNALDDLSDIFNFAQNPLVFQTITPPADTAACIADPSPPGDPDDD